ncbi:xylose isomerase-like protein [Dichotomopilus funicola]|uniref:Xylose isomerase-like protein n=1 Tax=Dichotomopilus funicola TaxID=1934379 RepID=A0AAN6ZLU3_9PEZI|nr:xylose isomerase-like protein [Dichotomopilus funicola]
MAFASCLIGLLRGAGFDGVELSFPDLLASANRYSALYEVENVVGEMCTGYGLKIMSSSRSPTLKPGPEEAHCEKNACSRARGWIKIMSAVGTDMLQVGSSDSRGRSQNIDQLAAEVSELADKLASHGFRLAYENWCWATHAPGLRDVGASVEKAGRPNIGLYLDMFRTVMGVLKCKAYEGSLEELVQTVLAEKVFFLQIRDAYRLDPPLNNMSEHESGLQPRGEWSHEHRSLPYDGGYLPIQGVVRAVLQTGFREWLSVEVFDGNKYGDDLRQFVEQGMSTCKQLVSEASASREVVIALDF